jgi:hypothetical protein
LAACTSWKTQEIAPEQVLAEEQPDTVRVTLTDGLQVEVYQPAVSGDTFMGLREGQQVSIPLAGVSVQQTAPPGGATNLVRVPPLTPQTAPLWRTPSAKARPNTEFVGASFVPEGGLSTAGKWALVLGLIVVGGAVVGGAAAAGEDDRPESFKSTHSTIEGVGLGAVLAIPVALVLSLLGQ